MPTPIAVTGKLKSATVMLLMLTILALSSVSFAQSATGPRVITLPRQPLEESLTEAGKVYGLTVVAPGDIVRGKTAPAISGNLTSEEAFRRLLDGSGLEAKRTSNGDVVVGKQAAPASEASRDEQAGLRLAPVVVTGERSERTVYETAASAAVISGTEIDRTPAFQEVDDILEFVPNVDLGGHSNEGPTIRGVKAGGPLSGVYAFFGGSRPRATITVDGRSVSYDEFIFGATSVWDVDRVEVFRGPQTTSQGVNSIAGAIHVVTADPTFEPHVKAQAEVGDYRHTRFSAAVSGPIIENDLAIRISADTRRNDTFIDMHPTANYGPDPNRFLSSVIRGKLLWEPSSVPELKTKLTLSRTHNEGPQAEYIWTDNRHDLDAINDNMPSRRMISNTLVHDISYDFTNSISVSNRFSYSDIETNRYVDVSSSGKAKSDRNELSNETNLHWKNETLGLSGLAGVFIQQVDSDEFLDYRLAGVGNFDDDQTSLGLYTELTYDITERLDLTVGIRYEQDQQKRTGQTVGGSLYDVSMDYDKTFEAFLPKIALGYDITDDFRVGGLVSRGFNPGGITVLWSTGETNYFDEETVWNYELFARTRLLDNRLMLNANVFYAQYTDYQLNYYAGDFAGNAVYGVGNANDAISYGAELSADYLATEDLRLYAGLGLLHTEIERFSDSGGIDAEGASFMRSPDMTLSLGADYEIIEDLTLGGRARYIGEYKSEDTNDSISAGDYVVVDMQASYDLADFTLYGYVNNVFDEFYTISELSTGRAIVGKPRDFGFGIKYSF